MDNFTDKIAVVTGAGSGIGRELVSQLIAAGAHVAACDVSQHGLAETVAAAAPATGQRLTTHRCDVAVELEVERFRDEVLEAHNTEHVNLLVNNAGIGGGGEFVTGERDEWERTFGVCWYGVYYGCRAFMSALVASDGAHLVNVSSVNGFWATIGEGVPHTAYSAAKFAVKGFSEALITDLKVHAPHVKVSVVMPGHIGTSIGFNTPKVLRGDNAGAAAQVQSMRKRLLGAGFPAADVSDEQLLKLAAERAAAFRDSAPTTAAQAAGIILDGVRAQRWRILVGADAEYLDKLVRAAPEHAYESSFIDDMRAAGHFTALMPGKDKR